MIRDREDEEPEYGDQHRIFMQAMLCRGIVDSKEFGDLYRICMQRCKLPIPQDPQQRLAAQSKFIKAINDRIEGQIHMKIYKVKDEEARSNKAYVVLANRKDNSGMENKLTLKAMLTFSPNEMEYIKLILRKIMQSEMKQISQVYALNCVTELGRTTGRRLSHQDAENVLERMRQHHWFRFDDHNPKIRMAPRFVKEMEPYLRNVYKDYISKCRACHTMVVQSVKCENDGCGKYYHLFCVINMSDKASNNIPKCLECQQALPKQLNASRVREEDTQDQTQNGHYSGGHVVNGGKRRITQGLESDSDSD